MKHIIFFFDRLEDKVRYWMSRRRIIYGFFGGIGVVLFWRGVWHTMDFISFYAGLGSGGISSTDLTDLWDGLLSFGLGSVLLLITGLFVSTFIGNEVIISGLKGEKKLADKTESEVRSESEAIIEMREEVKKIAKRLDEMQIKK